jgi:thymidylate synthase (FAD)
MKIIKPEVQVENRDWPGILKYIEERGRVCYKSEDKITAGSASKFVKGIVKSGHHSVLEHASISVKFTVDRGISHEIVRHRMGSYSQESTRYCNYTKGQFDEEIRVIEPFFLGENNAKWSAWATACVVAETSYREMLELGATTQEARTVLPNSLKTELWVTFNLREWRRFLEVRCAKDAHPQMRQVSIPLLFALYDVLPEAFSDIPYDDKFPTVHFAEVTFL